MHKANYVAIARILASVDLEPESDAKTIERITLLLSGYFQMENIDFNRDKFIKAVFTNRYWPTEY